MSMSKEYKESVRMLSNMSLKGKQEYQKLLKRKAQGKVRMKGVPVWLYRKYYQPRGQQKLGGN